MLQPFLEMASKIHSVSLDRDKSDGVKWCNKADLIVVKTIRLRRNAILRWKELSTVFPDIKVRKHSQQTIVLNDVQRWYRTDLLYYINYIISGNQAFALLQETLTR